MVAFNKKDLKLDNNLPYVKLCIDIPEDSLNVHRNV